MNAIDIFAMELLALMARHGVTLAEEPQCGDGEQQRATLFRFVAPDSSSIGLSELNELPTPDPQQCELESGETAHTCGQPGTYVGRCPDCDPY